MNRIAVAVALLCALSSTFAFSFEDCGSEVGKFGDISISSCTTTDEKCIFTRGNDIQVSLKFTPSKDTSTVEARAFGVMLDVPVPFPLEKPDVCKDGGPGVKCPLTKDQEYEYTTTFAVDKAVPALSIDVLLQFINDNDEKLMCVKFPVKIT
ncbi:PREDICTED: protein NPC2 homolog [Dinoponera quadriceps]|uniref:Protein NPC2 homolog n=1 Tax=Dinoponera quadriceps TaxID=609295 RepID=A0A6P3XUQ3_DINQU|nr:PREDICTED: protein NPC2 homolog [Dinoponera quadriceps]